MNSSPAAAPSQRIAVAENEDHMVAPAVDFATCITIVTVSAGMTIHSEQKDFSQRFLPIRVNRIREWNVDVLIGGGISHACAIMLHHFGVTVIQGITGATEEVVQAYLNGSLESGCYLLPGRGRRKHKYCGGNRMQPRGGGRGRRRRQDWK